MPLPEYAGSSRIPSVRSNRETASNHARRRDSVALADVVAVGDHTLAFHYTGHPQQVGRLAG